MSIKLEKQIDVLEVLIKANHTLSSDLRLKGLIVTRYRGKSLITVLDSTNHISY